MTKEALAVSATFLVAIRVIILGSEKSPDHGKIQSLFLRIIAQSRYVV